VYLACARGQSGVIGLNARDVAGAGGFRTQLRERLARVQAILDVAFGTQPKFGGPPIELR
jgi:SanA protein